MKCSDLLKLSILFTLTMGCQSFQKSSDRLWEPSSWQRTSGPEDVELKLKNTHGTDITSYQAKLYQKEYEQTSLVREKQSVVDFVVKTKKLKMTKNNLLVWELETVKKNGIFPLNTMAFPELKQTIPFTLKQNGQIVQAGSYHEDSIFYSPIVMLPNDPVKVGDTWAGDFRWRDSEDSPVYQMNLVSTHKGFVRCGSSSCAEIDISGSVEILGLDADKNDFRSHMQGRVYFDYKTGSIVYAHMSSEDEFISESYRTQSKSCLSSVLTEPKYLKIKHSECHLKESI